MRRLREDEMRNLQWVGLVVSLAMAIYIVIAYRNRRYSRLNLLLGLALSVGLLLLSLYPPIVDPFRGLLMMQNRWFFVIFAVVIVLFGLYFSLLTRVNAMNQALGALVRSLAKAEYHTAAKLSEEAKIEESDEKVICVVIPAYNEEKAIRGVLAELPKELLGYRVEPVVVVDGGEDDTESVARKEGHLVATHMVNRGQGDALRTGFEIAFSRKADIVMTMDADGQHQAADMEALVRPIVEGQADYVMGSRFLGQYEDAGGWRHLGILFFNRVIHLLAGVKITDCTNGFRAIRAEGLAKLDLREDRFNAPELLMEAARHKLRIREVPITVRKRAAGQSKKPPHLRYPLGFLATILKVWLR